MATTVKTGWLNDNNGDKFAPKTLSSQVITNDGIILEDKINQDLINLENEMDHSFQIKLDKKLSLPTSGSFGTIGQFAISDGNGGVTWLTVVNGNEVAY